MTLWVGCRVATAFAVCCGSNCAVRLVPDERPLSLALPGSGRSAVGQ